MDSLADRLRGVVAPSAGRRPTGVALSTVPAIGDAHAQAADMLGGELRTGRDGTFVVVDRRYAGGHRHGRVSVMDVLPPEHGIWPHLPVLTGRPKLTDERLQGRVVFFDLETTGLAGGAGTYAFLIGCGWFEGTGFRVQQFLLSSYTAERGILEALAEVAHDASLLVTFNGKSFDVPLIDTRFALHRLPSPFGELPHLDMLHVSRRLWRQHERTDEARTEERGAGCRLSDLERVICGHSREDDVPGFEIPSRYFHFVRSGDVRGLEAVLEHNRIDVLSLALLTARASKLVEDGAGMTETAREALGLGSIYERAGYLGEARAAYARASGLAEGVAVPSGCPNGEAADGPVRVEALRAFALLARRQRRHEEAATAWRLALESRDCPQVIAREATEALAVYHEHRKPDLRAARQFALQALQYRSTESRSLAVQHRLRRLDRKLRGRAEAEGLF